MSNDNNHSNGGKKIIQVVLRHPKTNHSIKLSFYADSRESAYDIMVQYVSPNPLTQGYEVIV